MSRDRIAQLEKQLEQALCQLAVNEAFLTAGVTRGAKVLQSHLASRLFVDYAVPNKPLVRALDPHGQPSTLTVADLVEEMRNNADFAGAFSGKGPKGGGDGGGGAPISPDNPFIRGRAFNVTKQSQIIKTDPDFAARLKAEAERVHRAVEARR